MITTIDSLQLRNNVYQVPSIHWILFKLKQSIYFHDWCQDYILNLIGFPFTHFSINIHLWINRWKYYYPLILLENVSLDCFRNWIPIQKMERKKIALLKNFRTFRNFNVECWNVCKQKCSNAKQARFQSSFWETVEMVPKKNIK